MVSAHAEVESAQAGIAAAEADLTLLKDGAGSRQRAIAGMEIDQARNNLWCAQVLRDALGGLEKKGYTRPWT